MDGLCDDPGAQHALAIAAAVVAVNADWRSCRARLLYCWLAVRCCHITTGRLAKLAGADTALGIASAAAGALRSANPKGGDMNISRLPKPWQIVLMLVLGCGSLPLQACPA